MAPAATKAYRRPMLIQKAPHMVLITVTSTSRARNPSNPAMNCESPPQNATKGKKIRGLSESPYHPAIHAAVMNVEPEKPASARAAGGAMGLRNIET